MPSFSDHCSALIASTDVVRLLARAPAVVFERLARGGGATRWYLVRSVADLDRLYAELRPGSVVSFYFDGRIASSILDEKTRARVLALAREKGDVVLGRLASDGFELLVDYVGGPIALDEFSEEIPEGGSVYFGAVPARDDDGEAAVTIILPDNDGVVRPHPH